MLGPKNYSLLHDFVVVCRQQNFSRAAEELNTVQSAVTQRIKRLEEAYGTRLVDRHSRGVKPTEQGLILYRYAEEIEALIRSAGEKLAHWKQSPSGNISIGIPPSVIPVLATPLISAFETQLPNVELTVAEAMSGYLEEWLESRRVDFAILFDRTRVPGIQVKPVLEEDLFLVVHEEIAQTLPAEVSIKDIVKLPLVLPSRRHATRRDIEIAAATAGVSINPRLSIDAGHQLIQQVTLGTHCSILVKSCINAELKSGVLRAVPITNPNLSRTVLFAEWNQVLKSDLQKIARDVILVTMRDLVSSGTWVARDLVRRV